MRVQESRRQEEIGTHGLFVGLGQQFTGVNLRSLKVVVQNGCVQMTLTAYPLCARTSPQQTFHPSVPASKTSAAHPLHAGLKSPSRRSFHRATVYESGRNAPLSAQPSYHPVDESSDGYNP